MTLTNPLFEVRGRIVRAARPLRVVLFGSYARGEAGPRSDYDVLVVMPDGTDWREATHTISEALSGLPVATDVVVTTPDEIARRGAMIGTVLRPALREGKIIYDTVQGELRCEPVSEADVIAETQVWLGHAFDDLEAAEALPPRGIISTPCYLAQQAAEKAIRAVLIFLQIEFPFIHNLAGLMALVPPGWQVKDVSFDAKQLNDWAVAGRYPVKDLPEPTEPDARSAVTQARAIVDAVARDLNAHGLGFNRPPVP